MRRYKLMSEVLAQLGVEKERVRLEWVSAAEGSTFAQIIRDFTADLRQLGPFKKQSRVAAGGEG